MLDKWYVPYYRQYLFNIFLSLLIPSISHRATLHTFFNALHFIQRHLNVNCIHCTQLHNGGSHIPKIPMLRFSSSFSPFKRFFLSSARHSQRCQLFVAAAAATSVVVVVAGGSPFVHLVGAIFDRINLDAGDLVLLLLVFVVVVLAGVFVLPDASSFWLC